MERRNDLLVEYHPESKSTVEDYEPFVGRERIDELKRLAEPLAGKGWVNVNSTFTGGGVAEILHSAVPFARGLGIDAQWYVISGQPEFFQVTKKFHNLLQGVDQPISLEEIFGAYLDTINANARDVFISSDLAVIHDAQPAALVMNGVIHGNVLWRCHVDTSAPDPVVWRFLLPYINQCAGAIFTMPEFVGPGLQIPLYQIFPCIDPLSTKNRPYTRKEALEILAPLFSEHGVDPDRPILAAISRYDIHKNQATLIKAFRRLREERRAGPPPYLILLGNTATDDPEGGAMLAELRMVAGEDPDLRFWVNVEDNDRVVGALNRIARGCLHVSTREGFGLVVSEALWQGTPVIGSRVGGIVAQIEDGRTGFLVDPLDVETIAKKMAHLIDHPGEADEMGARGREAVRERYLLPGLMSRYLQVMRFYTGADHHAPACRLNEVTYSEMQHARRRPYPRTTGLELAAS